MYIYIQTNRNKDEQTYKYTDTHRHTKTYTDKQTNRQKDSAKVQEGRQTNRHLTNVYTYIPTIHKANIHTGRQADRTEDKKDKQTNKQTDKQCRTGSQADKQTGVLKDRCLHIHDYNTYSKTDILYIRVQTDRTERQEKQTE
jgi:hypothetical protein